MKMFHRSLLKTLISKTDKITYRVDYETYAGQKNSNLPSPVKSQKK